MDDQPAKKTEAESFRESLEDIVAVGEKLAGHAKSAEDLLGMCKLALTNDGQLRLLLKQVKAK